MLQGKIVVVGSKIYIPCIYVVNNNHARTIDALYPDRCRNWLLADQYAERRFLD